MTALPGYPPATASLSRCRSSRPSPGTSARAGLGPLCGSVSLDALGHPVAGCPVNLILNTATLIYRYPLGYIPLSGRLLIGVIVIRSFTLCHFSLHPAERR